MSCFKSKLGFQNEIILENIAIALKCNFLIFIWAGPIYFLWADLGYEYNKTSTTLFAETTEYFNKVHNNSYSKNSKHFETCFFDVSTSF